MRISDLAAEFESERRRLMGLAYRMLGSVAEAEDAFVRLRSVEQVADVPAYLYTTVARLCLDRLKSARARREVYVGMWLPEPIVEEDLPTPDAALELATDLSFALLMTLERLTPPERTAFLLHDVFGQEYARIAAVLDRSESACRKLAERARAQVQAGAPRFAAQPEEEARLFQAFLGASSTGDVTTLMQLLAQDAILYTDGGGKRQAAYNPVYGSARIARFCAGLIKKPSFIAPEKMELRRVNGLPGCLITYTNGDVAVAAAEIREGRITSIYIVGNPDKLRHLRGHQATHADSPQDSAALLGKKASERHGKQEPSAVTPPRCASPGKSYR